MGRDDAGEESKRKEGSRGGVLAWGLRCHRPQEDSPEAEGFGYGHGDSRSRSRHAAASAKSKPEKAKPSQAQPSSSSSSSYSSSSPGTKTNDDEIVHFSWKPGMVLNKRYSLESLLGDGTFGRVLQAEDLPHRRKVAVKVIRDVPRYLENAKIEAEILNDIRKADTDGVSGCCVMYDTFLHAEKFYCLVFEPLGVSLYDFLKENGYRGYWMQDVQAFALQSLQALRFLHDRLRLTHTDLKPENILLQSQDKPVVCAFPRQEWAETRASSHTCQPSVPYLRPSSSRIKLIDFGNATYHNEHHSSVINTRQYRGPEVLLSLGWEESSDLWSIGCILMELYTGDQLFATHEELEHLALIERIIHEIPAPMMAQAAKQMGDHVWKWFRNDTAANRWRLKWPEGCAAHSKKHVERQPALVDQAMPQHRAFADMVSTLLMVEKVWRPNAGEALKHEFFSVKYND